MLKAANSFDIFDPSTGQIVLQCVEENLGFFTKMFRFTDYKRMTPFDINIRTANGELLLNIRRGVSFLLSSVDVYNSAGERIGGFKQKFFSIGGKFEVFDAKGTSLCMLKGKLLGWDFKFISGDNVEFATITKKWAGFAKEMFTSADNYVLQISSAVPANHPLRELILAAVMCIDLVLKE